MVHLSLSKTPAVDSRVRPNAARHLGHRGVDEPARVFVLQDQDPSGTGERPPRAVQTGTEHHSREPILGVGLNNGAELQRDYDPILSSVPLRDPTKYSHTMPFHNYFLSMTSEIGLVDVALFLTFFGLICSEARRWSRSHDFEISFASCAVLTGNVSLFIAFIAVAADSLYHDAIQFLLWLFAGLPVTFPRMAKDSPAR